MEQIPCVQLPYSRKLTHNDFNAKEINAKEINAKKINANEINNATFQINIFEKFALIF